MVSGTGCVLGAVRAFDRRSKCRWLPEAAVTVCFAPLSSYRWSATMPGHLWIASELRAYRHILSSVQDIEVQYVCCKSYQDHGIKD
jgi:hypothetical protein